MKLSICLHLLSYLIFVECTSFTSLLSRRHATAPQCSGTDIYTATEKCYGDLMALSEIPARVHGNLLQNVRAMCRSLKSSDRCFSREMQPCGPAGHTMAQMLQNMFEFVCGEGRTVLMSSGACWAHETLKEDIGRCTETMEEGFGRLGFNGWCDLTNDFTRCVGDEVEKKTACSSEAAHFMQEMVRRSVQPAADMMKCRLHTRAARDLTNILLRR